LSQQGESVYLFDAAANGGVLLDSISFGMQLTDLSIGRLNDSLSHPMGESDLFSLSHPMGEGWGEGNGEGNSWALNQPTFGAANLAASLGDPSALRINEWLARGTTPFNNDFIELYNPNPLPVNLGGLYLSDEILGWPDRHQMASLSFMAGHGYLRLFADGDPSAGADHLNFALSGDQGTIGLYLPDLTAIDSVWYEPQWLNISQGRSPNASSSLVFFDTPTPGAPNPIVSGPIPFGGALVINEVLASNATLVESNGRTPDWVELYNGTTNLIDLGDLSLTDDAQQPRRFVFAPGTILVPAGFLRILCDGGQPLTNNNTGFGLKSTGGAVYLFDTPAGGGTLLGAIVYGIQTPDLSIGRVPDGNTTNWVLTTPTPNAPNAAVPALASPLDLKVNEWMADSLAQEDDWFEIYNPSPLPVALGGLGLTDDLGDPTKHQIAPLSFLGVGPNAWQKFVADGSTGAGADHVGFALRASGEEEALGLFTADGLQLIDGYDFGQQQENVSEGRFPDGSPTVLTFPGTDSPGESNWRLLENIVINEVLTHTDPPFEDAIELHNLSDQPVDLGGWWLSDDNGTLQKYQIPSPTTVPAHGFVVIYEIAFTNQETANVPFALSSKGDETVLCAASNNQLTGYRAAVKFGAAAGGVSFGRYVTSDGREEFVAMSERTFGADDPASLEEFRTGLGRTNAYPKVGPVVISEVMYHPPDLGTNNNTRDEFIELHNITTAPVSLYDTAYPTNVWRLRDAVDFDFPTGTLMAPGDYLLVVGFDPENNPAALSDFRAAYQLPLTVPILGPWSGRLANDRDDIELKQPDLPDTNGVSYILVERVRYSDGLPWPAQADGTGFSLQRRAQNEFANDPANWRADWPTPGPAAAETDTDGDSMPDTWEIEHGLDPFNPADASLDSDWDGLTNLQEYHHETDPRDGLSGLRLEIAVAPGQANVVLSFSAAAHYVYAIDQTDFLGAPWERLQDFVATPTNRMEQITLPLLQSPRFYRLRLLAGPAMSLPELHLIQSLSAGQLMLEFSIPAELSCTVLFAPSLSSAAWTPLTNYPAATTNRPMQLLTPANGTSGFYHLRSP
jgi:hypothetical protein